MEVLWFQLLAIITLYAETQHPRYLTWHLPYSFAWQSHSTSCQIMLRAFLWDIIPETKECKIDSLCVKLKGKAEVKWSEMYGSKIVPYYNKEKFFSIKQFIF